MRPIKAFDQGLYDNPWSWRQRGALETRGLKFRRCWCHLSASSPPALLFSMRADHFAGLNNSEYLPDWVTGGPRPLNLLSFCPSVLREVNISLVKSEVWGRLVEAPVSSLRSSWCRCTAAPHNAVQAFYQQQTLGGQWGQWGQLWGDERSHPADSRGHRDRDWELIKTCSTDSPVLGPARPYTVAAAGMKTTFVILRSGDQYRGWHWTESW